MLSEKPWKPERTAVLILGTFVGISLFMLLATVAQHHNGGKKLDENSLLFLVLATMSLHGSALLAIVLVLWQYRLTWRQAFGFTTTGAARAARLGALAAVLFLPVGFVLQSISQLVLLRFHHEAPVQEAVEMLQKAQAPASRAYFIAFTVLIVPVVEEILFRGVLYPTIKQAGWPRAALWGTSLLFAAIHLNLPIFLPLFVLALALVWLYETTDNLLAPIVAHGVFNSINLVMFYFGDDFVKLLQRWSHAHS